jgi:hypothetical protein
VREAAMAARARCRCSQLSPGRAVPLRDLPADSSFPLRAGEADMGHHDVLMDVQPTAPLDQHIHSGPPLSGGAVPEVSSQGSLKFALAAAINGAQDLQAHAM